MPTVILTFTLGKRRVFKERVEGLYDAYLSNNSDVNPHTL